MDIEMTATETVGTLENGVEEVPSRKSPLEKNHIPLNSNLKPAIVGGHDITQQRAIFDKDDKNIIVVSNRQLFYYNVKECKQAGTAFIKSSKLFVDERIVASHRLDNSLYVFTNRGRVFIWSLENNDWSNELSLPLNKDVEVLLSCKMLSKRQYFYTVMNTETNVVNINCSMSRSERERPKSKEIIHECTTGEQNTYDLGCLISPIDWAQVTDKKQKEKLAKQRCLVYIYKSHVHFQTVGIYEKLHVKQFKQKISDEVEFTCVRANQKRPLVAAGDSLGRIYIYTGSFHKNKFNRQKLHWHTMPVNDLCFSSEGNCLYSVGGESGCVVIWDLTQNNFSKKRVVARLGMPIRYISCGNLLNQLILSFEDNEIKFMDTDNQTKPLKTFTKRTFDMYLQNNTKALRAINTSKAQGNILPTSSIGLLRDSKTDSIVTNAKTGWLQFYSPKSKSMVDCYNFLNSNILSLEKEAKVIPSDITRASLTLDGDWLAFYETRESDSSFPDVKLHIWQRSSVSKKWTWIQTAERLHSSTAIVDLKFSPDGRYLLSVSEDGLFHILHRVCFDAKSNSKQMYAKGFFGNVPKNLPSMGTFSQDSSVMAISLKSDTSLIWMIVDPYKLVYECQLNPIESELDLQNGNGTSVDESQNDVLGLHFGCHEPSQSIAPLCEVRTNSIRLWNILNPHETMEYLVKDRCQEDDEFTAAAFDQSTGDGRSTDHFAVCTKKNFILIFKLRISQASNTLHPLIVIDGTLPFSDPTTPAIYQHMCFLGNPILDIDPQCHNEPHIIELLNRLCLMNSRQELVSITDTLTIEQQSAENSCNEIKTFDMSELQAYFTKSVSTYQEETNALPKQAQQLDIATITEKQRKIRNRLEVQKMLKHMFTRIPSHNLPKMDILGPMILDKLT